MVSADTAYKLATGAERSPNPWSDIPEARVPGPHAESSTGAAGRSGIEFQYRARHSDQALRRGLVAFLDTPANPLILNLTPDWRLLSFVGAIAVRMSILFGLVPALRVSIVDPAAAMRQTSRGLTVDRHRARFQRGLLAGQIAVSLVLVVSALLFVQSFRNLRSASPLAWRHSRADRNPRVA